MQTTLYPIVIFPCLMQQQQNLLTVIPNLRQIPFSKKASTNYLLLAITPLIVRLSNTRKVAPLKVSLISSMRLTSPSLDQSLQHVAKRPGQTSTKTQNKLLYLVI